MKTQKMTLDQFIDQSEKFLDRKLMQDEINTIEKCECQAPYCSGWTACFSFEPPRLVV